MKYLQGLEVYVRFEQGLFPNSHLVLGLCGVGFDIQPTWFPYDSPNHPDRPIYQFIKILRPSGRLEGLLVSIHIIVSIALNGTMIQVLSDRPGSVSR